MRYTADDIDREAQSSIKLDDPAVKLLSSSSNVPDNKDYDSTHIIENQYYQQGDAVKIIKKIYPNSAGDLLLNDSHPIVYVEIIPTIKEINGLWLHEFIDERLCVPYISNIYKVDSMDEIAACLNDALNNQSRMDISDDRKFEFSSDRNYCNLKTKGGLQLDKSQRLIYWYPILANESGIYNTRTTLRFHDERNIPDIDYSLDIDIEDPHPVFNVGSTTLRNEIVLYSIYSPWLSFLDEQLDLVYDITYSSGSGKTDDLTVVLNDMKNCKFSNNPLENKALKYNKIHNAHIYKANLKENATINIYASLIFNKTGIFSIPEPMIDGRKYHFNDEEITVLTPLEKFREEIYVLFLLVGLILGDSISRGLFSHTRKQRQFLYKTWYIFKNNFQTLVITAISKVNGCDPYNDRIRFKTSLGEITLQLNHDMPNLIYQFREVVRIGLYNGSKFGPIINKSVINGGDLDGKCENGLNYTIIDSINNSHNDRGTVAIIIDETNIWNGQFTINVEDNNYLNKIRPVLGRVVDGMNVVDAISRIKTDNNEQPIRDIKIYQAELMGCDRR